MSSQCSSQMPPQSFSLFATRIFQWRKNRVGYSVAGAQATRGTLRYVDHGTFFSTVYEYMILARLFRPRSIPTVWICVVTLGDRLRELLESVEGCPGMGASCRKADMTTDEVNDVPSQMKEYISVPVVIECGGVWCQFSYLLSLGDTHLLKLMSFFATCGRRLLVFVRSSTPCHFLPTVREVPVHQPAKFRFISRRRRRWQLNCWKVCSEGRAGTVLLRAVMSTTMATRTLLRSSPMRHRRSSSSRLDNSAAKHGYLFTRFFHSALKGLHPLLRQ